MNFHRKTAKNENYHFDPIYICIVYGQPPGQPKKVSTTRAPKQEREIDFLSTVIGLSKRVFFLSDLVVLCLGGFFS